MPDGTLTDHHVVLDLGLLRRLELSEMFPIFGDEDEWSESHHILFTATFREKNHLLNIV